MDNDFDVYDDEGHLPNGWDNMAVWVDRDENQVPIHQLKTSHIQKILNGFAAGNSYFCQEDKVPVLQYELMRRNGAL